VILTIAAITIGAIAMGISTAITRNSSMEPAAIIRYALVITLAVYAVVGVLVVTQITPSVRLRWTDGRPALGVAVGLLVGGSLSALLLALVSGIAGHLDPDPRIVLLMSEGDAPHIVATVLLTCLAAPLVEEVLFRGLLLESLRRHRTALAIWISAAAFAIWHLMPALVPLCYYTLLGALLGFLYARLGLVCSMATHFAFNGVLTVAALSLVLSPGPTINGDGVTLNLPSGWKSAPQSALPGYLGAARDLIAVQGPSGAALVVVSFPTPSAPNVDDIVDRVTNDPSLGGFAVQRQSLHELRLPAGTAVEFDEQVAGHRATLIFLPHAGRSFEFVVQTAGSVKAATDVHRILQSMTLTE
jgi:membrane protease YdiL (CAAX protease family)